MTWPSPLFSDGVERAISINRGRVVNQVVDTEDAKARLRKMREDQPFFAQTCLKILPKVGMALIPFEMNYAQRYLHGIAERQLAETGWVRIIVLKGRQQGISTYIQSRFYQKTSLWSHRHAYILSHEAKSSEKIFAMADRFHRHNPIAPPTGKSSVRELSFVGLESSYAVGTAGSSEGGRGGTASLFHGSEVGFWDNDEAHFASSVQQVAMAVGTEIFLESTANGPRGQFFKRWGEAVKGIGDYIAVFIPWFWDPGYARQPEEGFTLTEAEEDGELSEVEYARMYKLSPAQMRWRRAKIHELGSIRKFKQEYPATAAEAFQSADQRSFIDPLTVQRARRRVVEPGGPLIIGVDPAGAGGDRFAVAFRRGRKVEKVIYRNKINAVQAVTWMKSIIDRHQPDKVFIDSGGLGAPLIEFLKAAGPQYERVVQSVNFGSKSQAKTAKPDVAGPKNRRAEMWARMKAWLGQEDEVQLPDHEGGRSISGDEIASGDAIQGDLTVVYVKDDLNNDLQLVSKEQLRKDGISSPDLGDAIALTFASTVYVEGKGSSDDWNKRHVMGHNGGPPMELERGNDFGYGSSTNSPLGWMG